ncbi:MAG: CBS domain-containing protein [Deltaproteobacteria bacterium]|nr:CBS domain-containing protein [Deltaproteobacteria bacterium]
MSLTARDVMDDCFQTLRPEMSIAEAVQIFERAGRVSGAKVFGLMVTDASRTLVGLLSIYDIFLLLRPKHIHIWGEMEDLEVSGILEAACRRAQAVLVGDIMTTEVITITPETHLLLIIDIMIKKHVRRLPVLEGGKIVGIVYISRVFDHLLEKLAG